jgi:predicted transcriptional regulator YdeE
MTPTSLPALHVTGLRVRTRNADEMQPDTARLGRLWGDFAQRIAPHLTSDSVVYGVYHRYASDQHGEYDVLVGAQSLAAGAPADLAQLKVAAGRYLVFEAQGPMPQAALQAWSAVWACFADSDCPHRRAFTADFERYDGPDRVSVWVALA